MELFNKKIAKSTGIKKIKAEYIKCECGREILSELIYANHSTCIYCGYLFRVSAHRRIKDIADHGTYSEMDKGQKSTDVLNFPEYKGKLTKARKISGINEAVVIGKCKISDMPVGIAVMDPSFMMGSMGEIVGNKICKIADVCLKKKMPLIIFCASGGARMQEGMVSLLQMSRTTIAINKLKDAGILYVSILTNPTTGGVTASFAMQGDIILAEPRALIAFAGPRVIQQTVNDVLPEGFQTTEYLMEAGFIDMIVARKDMKDRLTQILSLHR